MICSFLGVRSILLRIAQNVCGASYYFYLDFFNVVGLDIVFLDCLHHRGQRRMAERLDWETLHTAIENAIVRVLRARKILNQCFAVETRGFSLVLHMMKHREQTFLAINDVLGTGKSLSCKERALGAHATRPRIDCVLHVPQFPSCAR